MSPSSPFMSKYVLSCLFVVAALTAIAEPPPNPPAPPYVAAMPNPGHWIRKESESAGPQAAGGNGTRKPKEISTETWLVGNNRYDLKIFSDGTHQDTFLANGVCYQSDGTKDGFYIMDTAMDAAWRVPSVKEWPELAWVRIEYFKGNDAAEGYKCFVYEQKTADGVNRAMIEVTSRLPITLESKGEKYVYQYLTPSKDLPKPDASLLSTMEAYKRKLKSITVDRNPR